jgi:TolB-like protein
MGRRERMKHHSSLLPFSLRETRMGPLTAPLGDALSVVTLLVLLLVSLPGCTGTWKEAYQQGLDHLAAQRWDEATRAFDQAIQGNPREDGAVRLYGMRYGYFPYRNQGIALYQLGQWEAAIQALEESLRQGFSEEGASYLEHARQHQPRVELPRIFAGKWWDYYERGLLYGERGLWHAAIQDFQAALKARSDEDRFARTYGVSFVPYFPRREMGVALYYDAQYTAAVQTLERSLATVPTAKAAYYLNVARAALLRQSRPDPHPPQLTLTAPSDGLVTNLSTVEVQGTAESRNFVAAVAINGEPLLLETAAVRVPFAVQIPLASGPNTIEVVAQDLIGDETTTAARVVVDREGPAVAIERVAAVAGGHLQVDGVVYDNSRLGWFQINGRRIPLSGTVESRFSAELPGGGPTILLEAADAVGNLTQARLPIPAAPSQRDSRQRPQVVPVRWPAARQAFFPTPGPPTIDVSVPPEVQDEEILISWTVATPVTPLATRKINGEAKTVRQAEASKPQLFSAFSDRVRLKVGENIITLTAVNLAGQIGSKTMKIIRNAVEVAQIGSRLSVAVLPFQHTGQVSEFYQGTSQALVAALGDQRRFRIVEQSVLEKSLQALQLSQTDLGDPATAVRVGKQVAAEAILIGTVTEYVYASTREVEILVKLVNTETSTSLVTTDVFDRAPSRDSFQRTMRELAAKLRWKDPRVPGQAHTDSGRPCGDGLGRPAGCTTRHAGDRLSGAEL